MGPLIAAAVLMSAPGIDVSILSSHHPRAIEIRGRGEVHQLSARGDTLIADGVVVPTFSVPDAEWTVRLRGIEPRKYIGAMSIAPSNGELAIVVRVELEEYVAQVISAETPASTPAAALRAQAIVTRSYALARKRHEEADACDLTHCQALYGKTAVRADARAAAKATAGVVLELDDGTIAEGIFHANCGGHTADPREVFGGPDRSGARAVPDSGCKAEWQATMSKAKLERIATRTLQTPAKLSTLRFDVGLGGFVIRIVDPAGGGITSGDSFARALDGSLGWGIVRSSRFTLAPDGDHVIIRGNGWGHGAGLCQAGAARMARRGRDELAILAHFFPRAHVRAQRTLLQ